MTLTFENSCQFEKCMQARCQSDKGQVLPLPFHFLTHTLTLQRTLPPSLALSAHPSFPPPPRSISLSLAFSLTFLVSHSLPVWHCSLHSLFLSLFLSLSSLHPLFLSLFLSLSLSSSLCLCLPKARPPFRFPCSFYLSPDS